jgi:hypothetical protein
MRPLYRASFNLGNKKSDLSLDEIVEVVKSWSVKTSHKLARVRNKSFDNFSTGMTLSQKNLEVDTVRFVSSGKDYFALALKHPDKNNKNLKWKTTFAFGEHDSNRYHAEIMVSNGWDDGRLSPVKFSFGRPGLVPKLINQFGASRKFELSDSSNILTIDNVNDFAQTIFSQKRTLPIVYISANNFYDEPIKTINPERIAVNLAGVAHVFVADSRFPSFKLEKIVGKSMSCYDGAVRLYWPIQAENSGSMFHPLWAPQRITDMGNFEDELFKTIAFFSTGIKPKIGYEEVRRLKLTADIETLKEKNEIAELADLFALENDTLKKQVASLEDREVDHLEKIKKLEYKNSSLISVIQSCKKPEEESCQPVIGDFDSVEEAVEKFTELYPKSSLEILGRAYKSARECQYDKPEHVFKTLEWLENAYLEMRASGNDKKKKNGSTTLEESCKEQTGMTYKANQSEVTMGRNKQDYFTTWGGKNICLEEHIGKGSSFDPKSTLRIAFHYDSDSKKVVVGYIGMHQKN